jgi:flagellin
MLPFGDYSEGPIGLFPWKPITSGPVPIRSRRQPHGELIVAEGIGLQNQLNATSADLQQTLSQLASGSRINSGADDAAGLAISDGMQTNITALTQSERNANDGVAMLQVADGSLSQVTSLLNRAVTLATESANGTVTNTQRSALDAEFTQIKTEIDSIGTHTTFNGSSVFTGSTTSIFLSDGDSNSSIGVTVSTLGQGAFGTSSTSLQGDNLLTAGQAGAQKALTDISGAITAVAAERGNVGASINRLQAATNVMANQVVNLTSADNGILSADIAQTVTRMSKDNILMQTGMAAMAQANSAQQLVLTLLR